MTADAVLPGADTLALPDAAPEQRLHPLTLLMNLARQVPQIAFGLIALSFSARDWTGPWAGPAALALVLALFGIELMRWWRFTYRLDAQELRITSGILSRNVRSIPYERIQDVNLEQGPLARFLGMARVRLETGSSGSGDEGVLDSVDLAEAGRLRDVIRLRKAAADDGATAPPLADESEPLFAMDHRRVLIAGIFNFSLVFFALIGALFNQFDFLIPREFWNPRRVVDTFGLDDLFATLDLTARIIGVAVALVVLALAGLAGGIIRTALREHGFRLERTETGFRRRRGLLTLTDVVMPLHRIQAAVVETGPVRRRLGWYQLKLQSLASDTDKESDHSIAPLARRAEIETILAETPIRWALDRAALRGVDPAMWWVPMALLLPVPAAAIAVAASIANPWLGLLFALLPAAPLIAWLGWRAHGFALADGQLYVREGFWSQRLTLLPVRRVQSVDIRDSAVQRFLGLADLAIGMAGRPGALTIRALPLDDALALRTRLLALS